MSSLVRSPLMPLTGLRLGATALVAFSVAVLLEIPHPYWAAMPVWAMSQPTRGLLLERGIFRLLGTLFGALVGFSILRAHLPFHLAAALLAAWVALMTAAIPMLRGAHGYAPLLAAMTAGIVVVPGLFEPVNTLELAMSRVDCTLIGLAVGFLFGFLATPNSPLHELRTAVRRLGSDTIEYAAALLAGDAERIDVYVERKLLADLAEVQANAQIVGAGRPVGYRLANDVQAMAYAAVEVLASVHAFLERLDRNAAEDAALARSALASAVRSSLDAEHGMLPIEAGALVEQADPRLHQALNALAVSWHNLVQDGKRARREDAGRTPRGPAYLTPFRDESAAVVGGLSAGVATFAACYVAHASKVAQADLVALAVCMVSALLGSHPTPRVVGSIVFRGAAIGVVVAAAYRLLVLPHVDSLPMLIASVAPFLLVGGVARAHARTAGLAFDTNQLFLISSHAALPLDHLGMREVLAGSGALLFGIGLTCVIYALHRPSPHRRTQRLTQRVWQTLRRLCDAHHSPGERSELVRHIFNLSRHGHAARLTETGGSPMAALRLLDSIAHLRRLREGDPMKTPQVSEALRHIRDANGRLDSKADALDEIADSCRVEEVSGAVRVAASALRACHATYGVDPRMTL
ncbi:FUSC family protein [Variovorax sp. YR216]|uniref:FUSC family protein n=1 Tax=Variovorax sp. YR216 TaxID=1882828 RepID=UPI000898B372|nr:FUSC family protein [Variovorax sp. YR216]SEA85960.1 Uncharacterized membrane protein YccC [Variovorax sp. YR216]